jgi:hypothetical protein
MYGLVFSTTLSEAVCTLRIIQPDIIINVYMSSLKVPFIVTHIWKKPEFSWQIFENNRKSNFKKTRLVGAALFHSYGQTDVMKLVVAFHKFLRAPVMEAIISSKILVRVYPNTLHRTLHGINLHSGDFQRCWIIHIVRKHTACCQILS